LVFLFSLETKYALWKREDIVQLAALPAVNCKKA